MATVDSFGNLLKSEILISSGDQETDKLALQILQRVCAL
jgi:outer membrane biosynthesis protein TonB